MAFPMALPNYNLGYHEKLQNTEIYFVFKTASKTPQFFKIS